MLDKQFWVGKKTPSSEGEGVERTLIREILSAATSSQIPNHETTKKDATQAYNTVNKLKQGKLREITKCLLTQFS